MRIVFLVPHLARISGGVRIICEYARRLAANGHKVTLICKERQSPIVRNILHKFVNTVKWIDLRNVTVDFVAEFKPELVPDSDILFATSWQTAAVANSCAQSKGRKFYLIQGLEILLNPITASDAEQTYYLPLSKITVSKWLQTELKKRFNQDSVYIPNAVDHTELYPDNKMFGTKKIGMLFHTADYKGFKDGLKAMEIVSRSVPDIKLVLFGTRYSDLPDIKYRYEYHYNPNAASLRKIYSACDIFVSPSWHEGFGLPGLEAMACKSALATTDNGGCRDYAIDNETALLSPPDKPQLLAENISKLLHDGSLIKKISEQGYQESLKFNWKDSVEEMEKLINI